MAAGPMLLPDFPAEARPGECWTRVPAGSGASMGAAPAGQPVWTLKRGHGPEAVWQFDRRPTDGRMAGGFDGPYTWVRVACSAGDRAYAEAPPAMLPVPPAPPMVHAPAPHGHPGAMHQAPMHHGQADGMQHGQMQQGHMHQGHMHHDHMRHGHTHDEHVRRGEAQQGPRQHGPMMHGPMMHGPMHQPPHGPYAGAPMPPMMEPAYAPPPSPPRWFGDRMLTWAGKTPW
jgi:hypothetical protein